MVGGNEGISNRGKDLGRDGGVWVRDMRYDVTIWTPAVLRLTLPYATNMMLLR